MRKTAISVTEAARNFAEYVNRAHYQNSTFILLKNGSPVAQLAPVSKKVCLGRDLAEVLKRVDLPAEEARAWSRDMKRARKSLKAPKRRW